MCYNVNMKTYYYFSERRSPKELPIVQAAFGNEVIYINNPWTKLDEFEKGDILICYGVDELSETADINESYGDIAKDYMDLYNKGIELMFEMSPQCNSVHVKSIVGYEQSFEAILRKCILTYALQKQAEARYSRRRIITAQQNGSRIGRKKGETFTTKKSIEMKARIKELSKDFDGTLSDEEVFTTIGLSRNSYYKYKKELREEGGKANGIFRPK